MCRSSVEAKECEVAESLRELVRRIVREKRVLDYYNFLKEVKRRGIISFGDLCKLKNVRNPRGVFQRLIWFGAFKRLETYRGKRYMLSERGEELLNALERISKNFDKLVKREMFDITNMEWVLRVIMRLHEKGVKSFKKGLFFKTLYEYIDELERKGYVVVKPKLVSIDRCLRFAVELGYLARAGTKQDPTYIINEEKLQEMGL